MLTNQNIGIFEDHFLRLSLTVFCSFRNPPCLLFLDFPLILNCKEPSASWKVLSLPWKAVPSELSDILVTSTWFWQSTPKYTSYNSFIWYNPPQNSNWDCHCTAADAFASTELQRLTGMFGACRYQYTPYRNPNFLLNFGQLGNLEKSHTTVRWAFLYQIPLERLTPSFLRITPAKVFGLPFHREKAKSLHKIGPPCGHHITCEAEIIFFFFIFFFFYTPDSRVASLGHYFY